MQKELDFNTQPVNDTPHSSTPTITGDSRTSLVNTIGGTLASKGGAINRRGTSGLIAEKNLFDLYRCNAYARKVIDLPASEVIREWRSWDADEEVSKQIELYESSIQMKQMVRKALIHARLYGGCHIYMSIDGAGEPNEPIDFSKITKDSLAYLQIMKRNDFQTPILDENIGKNNGKPVSYILSPTNNLRNIETEERIREIHPDRLITFYGAEFPEYEKTNARIASFYGVSYLDSLYDTLVEFDNTLNYVKEIIKSSKLTYIFMPGLGQALEEGGAKEENIASVIATIDFNKDVTTSIPLDGSYTVQQNTQTLAGFKDVLMSFMQDISGRTGIPMSKLFGISASGLSTTNEDSRIDYYEFIRALQGDEIQPSMAILDRVLAISATGDNSLELTYNWNELVAPVKKDVVSTLRMSVDLAMRLKGLYSDDYIRALIDKEYGDAGMDIADFSGKKEAEPIVAPAPTPPEET